MLLGHLDTHTLIFYLCMLVVTMSCVITLGAMTKQLDCDDVCFTQRLSGALCAPRRHLRHVTDGVVAVARRCPCTCPSTGRARALSILQQH